MSISEIHALLALMDDPDETVYLHVRDRLLSKGKEVLPFVDDEVVNGRECDLFQNRLAQLKEGLQQTDIQLDLVQWMEKGGRNLWEGIQLVQRAASPLWDEKKSNREFELLKREVWLELNDELTALEQIRILNHVFFSIHQMQGVRRLPHAPEEALPSSVLLTKKGNPIGLGMLYLAVAQSLGIPMKGINLPNHFILAYCDESHVDDSANSKGQAGILFYVNPYSQGMVIGPDDVSEFLAHVEPDESARQWRPAHPMETIQRLVKNVAFALKETDDDQRSLWMLELFQPLLVAFENAQERSDDQRSV